MLLRPILLIISIFFFLQSFSQIPLGQWREHLPYNKAISLADDNAGRIYCATPYSLFYFDKNDQSINKLNSVNKLSDIGVSTIAFDPVSKTLIIAYENGNIDLMKDDVVFNLADIKRKPIIGGKRINHILVHDAKAYLSTNFGIVVLDLKRREIKDTYFIGPNAKSLKVNQLALVDSFFYAATETGIFKAIATNPNLANFQYWTLDSIIPNYNKEFSCLTVYDKQVIAGYKGASFASDTMYIKSSSGWDYFMPHLHGPLTVLKGIGDTLIIGSEYGFSYYFNNLLDSFVAFDYNQSSQPIMPRPNDIIIDNEHITWIADEDLSLVSNPKPWNYTFIIPSGPYSKFAWNTSLEGGALWVVSGGYEVTGGNSYIRRGFYRFVDEDWLSWNSINTSFLDTIDDLVSVAVNPSNPNEVFIGTWGQGLIKIKDGKFAGFFNETNSSLQIASNRPGFIGISDLTYDMEGNLWVSNTSSPLGLSRLSPDGKWKAFNLAPYVNEDMTGQVVIDDMNQKWLVLQRGKGLLVYNDNFTPDNTNDDLKTLLTSKPGSGGLPSNTIYCIANDLDGEIWVGTDKGVAVFYAPELVFTGNEFDAQQIYIEQEGISQYLLESEEVTSIVIDGANRKWFGTRNAGVFLMSADGTEQIFHFNIDNSPLLSNNILSISIDQKSGEVFFATDGGIISYRNDATQGSETHTDVKVFPNPVRPEYNGQITVSGLVTNANIKITDIAGNLVFETTANGGTTTWNGKTLSGERVATGVYLVFSMNDDGSEKIVSKILFVN